MKTKLKDRVLQACEARPELIVHESNLNNTEGFSLAEFEALGLSKQDLNRLCRNGLAIKGYKQVALNRFKPHKLTRFTRYLLLVRDEQAKT